MPWPRINRSYRSGLTCSVTQDGGRLGEADAREFGLRRNDDQDVLRGQRSAEAGVVAALAGYGNICSRMGDRIR
jgi:hypothetical protein